MLGTKIHRPVPRRDLVHRPRLTDLLGRPQHPRLVLVAAPAGFGKTTLLTQWLGSTTTGTAVAWLSLDEGDNDPRRFLEHLLAAISVIGGFTEATDLLASANHGPPGHALTDLVLTSIVNDLDTHPADTVIALDDYHVITDPDVQRSVAFLLEHVPRHATLAIATRADPNLPLPRLRARRELVEIRAAELRFTPDEATAFLADAMQLDLTDDQATALATRTEGWPAGLQLAGLSLRGTSDTVRFVADFAGTHRFVLDYLVEEVLGHQPEAVRRFLLDTSVLDELTGDLCDAVTGRDDSAAVLESLERDNLFVVPLDDQRQWYRYHHLFADALRARLAAQDPARVPALHRSASDWYAARSRSEDAVRHALAGNDPGHAAYLVEQALPDVRRERRDVLLRQWSAALPDNVIRDSALLSICRAWTRLIAGDPDGVEAWLEDAERAMVTHPPTPEPGASVATLEELRTLPATIAIYRASAAQARGDAAATTRHARTALDLTGPEDHMARGGALGFLGLGAWARGDLAEAVTTFSQALQSLAAAGDVSDALGGTVGLGSMWQARGRPDEARRLFERALDTAGQGRGAALATLGDLHVGLASVLVEQGELDAAAEHLTTATSLGESASLPENRFRWCAVSSDVHRAHGELDAAVDLLDRAEELRLPGYYPDVRPIPAARARLHLEQGRLDDARAWARDVAVAEVEHPGHLDEYAQLTLVRLLLAEHESDGNPTHMAEALRRLDALEPDATRGGRDATLTDIARLREAARGRTAYATAGTAGAPTASDALSGRELDVLRLLATALSGPEIARELFVSVNTLRTHTKHIFTKLDVTTRRTAVERGQELGLL